MKGINLISDTYLKDRRASQRVKVDYLAEVYLGSEILFATAIDVSEEGIGIILPGKFYIGEMLNIRIKSTLQNPIEFDQENVNICLTAKVVWLKKHDKMYRAGLNIIDIEEADLDMLRKNIRDILS